MSLYDKLNHEDYDSLTREEKGVLVKAFRKAPSLFRERREKTAIGTRLFTPVFGEDELEQFFRMLKDPWTLFWAHAKGAFTKDVLQDVFIALDVIETSAKVNRVLSWLLMIAVYDVKGIPMEDLIRYCDYGRQRLPDSPGSMADEQGSAKQRVYNYRSCGKKWRTVFAQSGDQSGLVLCVGSSNKWRNTKLENCGLAAKSLVTRQPKLYAVACRYTAAINCFISSITAAMVESHRHKTLSSLGQVISTPRTETQASSQQEDGSSLNGASSSASPEIDDESNAQGRCRLEADQNLHRSNTGASLLLDSIQNVTENNQANLTQGWKSVLANDGGTPSRMCGEFWDDWTDLYGANWDMFI